MTRRMSRPRARGRCDSCSERIDARARMHRAGARTRCLLDATLRFALDVRASILPSPATSSSRCASTSTEWRARRMRSARSGLARPVGEREHAASAGVARCDHGGDRLAVGRGAGPREAASPLLHGRASWPRGTITAGSAAGSRTSLRSSAANRARRGDRLVMRHDPAAGRASRERAQILRERSPVADQQPCPSRVTLARGGSHEPAQDPPSEATRVRHVEHEIVEHEAARVAVAARSSRPRRPRTRDVAQRQVGIVGTSVYV